MAPTATERPTLPANLRRTSLWTFVLLGVSAFAFLLDVPSSLIVLVVAPAAISCAIASLIYSRGVEAAVGIRIWLWVAIAISAMSFLGGLGVLLMREPLEQLQACYARSVTPTATRECDAEYEKAYNELLERYGAGQGIRNG